MAQELAKPEVVDFCSAKLVSIMGSSVAMFNQGQWLLHSWNHVDIWNFLIYSSIVGTFKISKPPLTPAASWPFGGYRIWAETFHGWDDKVDTGCSLVCYLAGLEIFTSRSVARRPNSDDSPGWQGWVWLRRPSAFWMWTFCTKSEVVEFCHFQIVKLTLIDS